MKLKHIDFKTLILVLFLIILVIISLVYSQDINKIINLTILGILYILYQNYNDEHKHEENFIPEDVDPLINTYPQYEPKIRQELNNKKSELDNSDVIKKASSSFVTLNDPPLSITNNAAMSNFYNKMGGHVDNYSNFTIPINDHGITLDEALARKQAHRSLMNKRAIDGSVRTTKKMFEKFFQQELNENEKRVWWSSESNLNETDMMPY